MILWYVIYLFKEVRNLDPILNGIRCYCLYRAYCIRSSAVE